MPSTTARVAAANGNPETFAKSQATDLCLVAARAKAAAALRRVSVVRSSAEPKPTAATSFLPLAMICTWPTLASKPKDSSATSRPARPAGKSTSVSVVKPKATKGVAAAALRATENETVMVSPRSLRY